MSIWVVMVYDYCEWEIMDVLFDADAVEPLVAELFGESEDYTEIKVECWHRDDIDSPDASFYGVETYVRDDYVKGE
jgi:hypothetical protein